MKQYDDVDITVTYTTTYGKSGSVNYNIVNNKIALKYDDHYDITGKTVEIIDAGAPTSYQVGYGVAENTVADTAVVTLKDANTLVATGTGTAKVRIDGVLYEITVTPAPISLLLLIGQSNAEGMEGVDNQSVICPDGQVYSTYAKANGLTGDAGLTVENAGNYVPSALTGVYSTVNVNGTDTKLSGYPVNSLTEVGVGKYGMDSGLAYEWVKQTGEKVWVVNAAHGASSITSWQKGADNYNEAIALFRYCQSVLLAEIKAGHYTFSHMGYYWNQGCADETKTAEWYVTQYLSMHENLKKDFARDMDINTATPDNTMEFAGIVLVQAGHSNATGYRKGTYEDTSDQFFMTYKELEMRGPRVAQIWMANNPELEDIYIVSTLAQEWVTMPDGTDGVTDYFKSVYENGKVDYKTQIQQKDSWYTPTTPASVKDSIHYNQIGYNEIGRESAKNTLYILGITEKPQINTTVEFLDWTGFQQVEEIKSTVAGNSETLVVPLVSPCYESKNVSYTLSNGLTWSYYDLLDGSTDGGTLTASVGAHTVNVKGREYRSYCFELVDGKMVSVENDVFYKNNLTLANGSTYKLSDSIILKHDKEWVVEFNSVADERFMALASTNSSTDGMFYIFKSKSGSGVLSIGEYKDGLYQNYGLKQTELDIDWSQPHVYRFQNVVNSDGTNEIYVYVDDKLAGTSAKLIINEVVKNTDSTYLSGKEYKEALALFNACQETLRKEISAGHFTLSHMGYFWCQGCSDATQTAEWYVNKYLAMHNNLKTDMNFDHDSDPETAEKEFEFGGIIPVRTGSNGTVTYRDGTPLHTTTASYYESFKDLRMSGPRVAQYWMGNNPELEDIWLVCNIGEDWVWMPDGTNGVTEYFNKHYENGRVDYQTQVAQKDSWYTPTTPAAVHDSIHYNQIGYNEVGKESVRNALIMLGEMEAPNVQPTVSLYSWDGYTTVTDVPAYKTANSKTLVVPVVSPLYKSKELNYTVSDGVNYNYYDLTVNNLLSVGNLTVSLNGTQTVNIEPIELSSFSWEFDGETLISTGENENTLHRLKGTTVNGMFVDTQYRIDRPITLVHDEQWVLEFKLSGPWYDDSTSSKKLFCEDGASATPNAMCLLIKNNENRISIGYYGTTTHISYGIDLDNYNISMADTHIYRLVNHINDDGTNTIYLFVDGEQIGPMISYFTGSSGYMGSESDYLSGKDLTFGYLGTPSYLLDAGIIEYISVIETGADSSVHFHDWSEWDQVKAPGPDGVGIDERVCSTCLITENRTVNSIWQTTDIADHWNELPENLCAGTNLWSVLEHDPQYYVVSSGNWGDHSSKNVPSVTFAVKPGDKIFATSFGKAKENGHASSNGIRLTFFGIDGVVKTTDPAGTYSEFTKNGGYIVAPEGAIAVNIPMWGDSTDYEIYILNREHDYKDNDICNICNHKAIGKGYLYIDHLNPLPESVCSGTNLWSVLEHNDLYFSYGVEWAEYESGQVKSVTFLVNPGDKIYATSFGSAKENGSGNTNGIRMTFFGDYAVVKSMVPADTYAEFSKNGYLTVPEGAVAVNIPMWNNSDENELYILNKEHSYTGATCDLCGNAHPNAENYKGKVISILGDSISTFAGYIPVADGFNLEHKTRYPQDNLLTDVNETWWMQIINNLDAKLGINDSWRSSEVYNYIDEEVNSTSDGTKACMASTTRIQNLGSNGTPDVILFFGGTNDITQSRPIGTFDPSTAPTSVNLTSVKWETVVDAYIDAIMRMQYYYPNAQIIALLPYDRSSQGTAKVDKYNNLFAEICDHYGVPYVDLRQCGISMSNIPDGTHPDADGMAYITDAVLETLMTKCQLTKGKQYQRRLKAHLSDINCKLVSLLCYDIHS